MYEAFFFVAATPCIRSTRTRCFLIKCPAIPLGLRLTKRPFAQPSFDNLKSCKPPSNLLVCPPKSISKFIENHRSSRPTKPIAMINGIKNDFSDYRLPIFFECPCFSVGKRAKRLIRKESPSEELSLRLRSSFEKPFSVLKFL